MTTVAAFSIDLGSNHSLKFTRWTPDRSIPELADRYRDMPDEHRLGAVIDHFDREGNVCRVSILFDNDCVATFWPDRPVWKLETWIPLNVSPSILCEVCGDHGYIRDGRWEHV